MKEELQLTPELPFFDLFQSIREYELNTLKVQPLTIDEYTWVVKALDGRPFRLKDKEAVYELVKLLWFKPYHGNGQPEPDADSYFRYRLFEPFWKKIEQIAAEKARPERTDEPKAEQQKPQPRSLPQKDPETGETTPPEQSGARETRRTRTSANDPLTPYWVTFEGGPGQPEKKAAPARNFLFLDKEKLLPLEARRLYQLLKSIRKEVHEGAMQDVDMPGTIRKFARQGYLENFAFIRSIQYKWQLHLLIDHGGSMAAFDHLGDVISEFLQGSSNHGHRIWYFNNCPVESLYEDKLHTAPYPIDQWVNQLEKDPPGQVLIFSDGGAARGYHNPERVQYTRQFLEKLKRHNTVWLNPIPKGRWENTTASSIRSMTTMFEASDGGFKQAMQVLKGKT